MILLNESTHTSTRTTIMHSTFRRTFAALSITLVVSGTADHLHAGIIHWTSMPAQR
jgi:hypothetical protein